MTENEQIEEMARDLRKAEFWTFDDFACEARLDEKHTAENLYRDGYRKVERGEWGFDGSGRTCSECGEYALCDKHGKQMLSNNCPHCGADMRGVTDER